MKAQWTYTITAKEVYGEDFDLKAALGGEYEVYNFAPPLKGEKYISSATGEINEAFTDHDDTEPRYLVNERMPRRWVFEETTKEKATRALFEVDGDVYMCDQVPSNLGFKVIPVRLVPDDQAA